MKVVAFVPIRLNSQRVEGKNLRLLGGEPLLCHILRTLLEVEAIDEVYVYCSDPAVRPYLPDGVRFLRRSADQHIHPAFHAEGLFHKGRAAFIVRHVQWKDGNALPQRRGSRSKGAGPRNHAPSVLGEGLRRSAAQSARCSNDPNHSFLLHNVAVLRISPK